jgi:hypothetical protein
MGNFSYDIIFFPTAGSIVDELVSSHLQTMSEIKLRMSDYHCDCDHGPLAFRCSITAQLCIILYIDGHDIAHLLGEGAGWIGSPISEGQKALPLGLWSF